MKTAAQKIADFAYEKALMHAEEAIEDLIKSGATPIEAPLFVALTYVVDNEHYFKFGLVEAVEKTTIGIEPQKKVEKFIVDFVVSVVNERTGKKHFLAVECDGHDFHERTKDQAKKDRSRDRRLQELGFTIYRFTGSEIFADPIKCAEVILEWIYAASWVRD